MKKLLIGLAAGIGLLLFANCKSKQSEKLDSKQKDERKITFLKNTEA